MLAKILAFAGLIISNDLCDPCITSDSGIAVIKQFEGFYPYVYKDSADLDTIGFGHLVLPGEKFDQPLMGKAAEDLLRKDLRRTERAVNDRVTVKLKQNQFDALSSWTFNVGGGSLKESTLLKKVNAREHKEVPAQIKRWVFVTKGGVKIKVRGLENRREIEADLYAK